MIDIIGKRYIFFGISLVLILPGLFALLIWGLPLSVDFTGGSLVEFQFKPGQVPSLPDARALYSDFGYPEATVRSSGDSSLIIRTRHMDDATNAQIYQAFNQSVLASGGDPVVLLRFDSVGPTIGREIALRAVMAVAFASLAIMTYIWYSFRGVDKAHRYGISAILAMLHDVALMFGAQAFFSRFLGWEADSLFLTAVLTVIGFSVHDSIVVFDRIRENSRKMRRTTYENIVNASVAQSLTRSINTQLTVLVVLIAMAVFGGDTIRPFILIMMVGILSGTYSSICTAAPILVIWQNEEWKTWFNRGKPQRARR